MIGPKSGSLDEGRVLSRLAGILLASRTREATDLLKCGSNALTEFTGSMVTSSKMLAGVGRGVNAVVVTRGRFVAPRKGLESVPRDSPAGGALRRTVSPLPVTTSVVATVGFTVLRGASHKPQTVVPLSLYMRHSVQDHMLLGPCWA